MKVYLSKLKYIIVVFILVLCGILILIPSIGNMNILNSISEMDLHIPTYTQLQIENITPRHTIEHEMIKLGHTFEGPTSELEFNNDTETSEIEIGNHKIFIKEFSDNVESILTEDEIQLIKKYYSYTSEFDIRLKASQMKVSDIPKLSVNNKKTEADILMLLIKHMTTPNSSESYYFDDHVQGFATIINDRAFIEVYTEDHSGINIFIFGEVSKDDIVTIISTLEIID